MSTATTKSSGQPTVVLEGRGLRIDDVVAVARDGAPVVLGDTARAAMQRSADLVEGFVASDSPVYGVTTGFGAAVRKIGDRPRTASKTSGFM